MPLLVTFPLHLPEDGAHARRAVWACVCFEQDLLNFPEDIRKKMYLTHYGDNYTDFDVKKESFGGLTKQGHYYFFE